MNNLFLEAGFNNFTDLTNRLFEKRIINYGNYVDPRSRKGVMSLDRNTGDQIIKNFKSGILDSVPLQFSHDEDDPKNNIIGRVIALKHGYDKDMGEGLDAVVEVADDDVASKLNIKLSDGGGLYRGVSVGLVNDYVPTRMEGEEKPKSVGTILRHLAIVTHGHIKGMKDFKPFNLGESASLVLLHESRQISDLDSNYEDEDENEMNHEDVLKYLNEKGYSLASWNDLDSKLNTKENTTVLAELSDIKKTLNLSDGTSLTDAIVNMAERVKTLETNLSEKDEKITNLSDTLMKTEADNAVTKLMREGKIIPASKDEFVQVYLNDKNLFAKLTSNLPKIVDFKEGGANDDDSDKGGSEKLDKKDLDEMTDRLVQFADAGFRSKKN